MQSQDQQPQSPQMSPQPYNEKEWRAPSPEQLQPSIDNNNPGQPTQVVFSTRPLDPQAPTMSEAVRERHDKATHDYPDLNLSEGEYVISVVKRHPIGLLNIWGVVGIVVGILGTILALYLMNIGNFATTANGNGVTTSAVAGLLLLIIALVLLGGMVATSIYNGNRFYLTNESVIQYIQTGLFAKREQTVSLGSVEDSSYSKDGIIQSIFDYGSIRLSTVGDETTYRFHYVADPQKQVALLNNAVENFKNGRPVHGE